MKFSVLVLTEDGHSGENVTVKAVDETAAREATLTHFSVADEAELEAKFHVHIEKVVQI